MRTWSCRPRPGRRRTAPSPIPIVRCMGRQALPLPGDTRHDWWLIQEIARRIGLPWNYQHPSEVFTEMAALMPSLANISWDRVERESAVTYPTDAPDQPGHD